MASPQSCLVAPHLGHLQDSATSVLPHSVAPPRMDSTSVLCDLTSEGGRGSATFSDFSDFASASLPSEQHTSREHGRVRPGLPEAAWS